MKDEYVSKLARLAVIGGVNLQKGQPVVINCDIEAAPLARKVVDEAYKAGAKECIVRFSDEWIDHKNYLEADDSVFEKAPDWKAALLNDTAADNAAYIHIIGGDPDLMSDVNPRRMLQNRILLNEKTRTYRDGLETGKNAWTIIAYPNTKWARKVYPDLSETEAVEALAQDIFDMSRVDENDPLENWKKHNESFQHRIEKLNDLKLKKLHYTNSHGTDLWVELPDNYLFAGGGTALANGVYTYPNIPTEEMFSAPRKEGVNGKLVSTMPLNLDGQLVEDFWFEFKDGKIVDFDAAKGKELLEEQLNADEGSRYLGEIALVPYGSPIQKKNRIYYNTLFDENASCHFALGKAYLECVKGALEMDEEARKKAGLNESKIHIDFMVGSDDLKIEGHTEDGKVVVVFEEGKFSREFDQLQSLA